MWQRERYRRGEFSRRLTHRLLVRFRNPKLSRSALRRRNRPAAKSISLGAERIRKFCAPRNWLSLASSGRIGVQAVISRANVFRDSANDLGNHTRYLRGHRCCSLPDFSSFFEETTDSGRSKKAST